MKTIKTATGWKEITTKIFNVETLYPKPYMTVGKWIESNKRIGLYRKRKKCNCCKTPWESIDPNENLFTVFTDKGHKPVCSKCQSLFSNASPVTEPDTPTEIMEIMKALGKAEDTIWINDGETVFERLWWLHGECGGDESVLKKEFPENA